MEHRVLFCYFLLWSTILDAQVSFVANTDTRQSLTGSPFSIEFRLSNAEGTGFQAPDFGGLTIVGGPSRSMSTTIINGSMSSSIGYVYTLVGTKPGKYLIGQAKINVSGKVMKTSPLEIIIVKGTASSNKDKGSANQGEVFIRLSTDKNEYFLGQQIILTTKLFTQVNIDNIESVKSKLPDKCEVEYISTEEPVVKEVLNGKEYSTKILSREAIFPLSAGKLNFPARAYRVIISNPDPWGFSMKSMFFNTAQVLESNSLNIQILELPKPIPENFSGGVGNFNATFSSVNPVYSLSDAIRIQLNIEGDGNFNHLDPKINLRDSLFEVLQPGTSTSVKIAENPLIKKSQSFEFLLSPKSIGSVQYYPSFCYFDPNKKIYIQNKDSIKIKIVESEKLNLNQDNEVLNPIVTHQKYRLKLGNDSFLLWLLLISPMLFAFYSFVLKDKLIENNNSNSWLQKLLVGRNAKDSLDIHSDIDALLIQKSKMLFSDAAPLESIYQLKNFLLQKQKTHSKAQWLLNLLNESEYSKFNPSISKERIQDIKQQIINL